MAITGVMKATAVITALKRAVKTGAMVPAMRLFITTAMAATATGMTVAVKPPDLKKACFVQAFFWTDSAH